MQTKKKEKPTKGSSLWGILIFAILILVDQLTKAVAETFISGSEEYPLFGGLIYFRLVYNRGISFGMGNDASPAVKIGVIAATAVIMLVLSVLYFKIDKRRAFMRTAFVFIVSGGVGNLIDRVYYKVWKVDGALGVRDMVDLSKFGFAVCNFADFFISAGAVMLVLAFLFFDTDAFFPVGKYKLLQKEAEEREEAKKTQKKEEEKEDER
ncbi:MAG: signal peptidase II [Clostridia bacterium]|nr:signal peptidase II [Clostridia bacterium]